MIQLTSVDLGAVHKGRPRKGGEGCQKRTFAYKGKVRGLKWPKICGRPLWKAPYKIFITISPLLIANSFPGATVYQTFPEAGNMGRVLPKYLSNWTTRQLELVGVNVKPETKLQSAVCKDDG